MHGEITTFECLVPLQFSRGSLVCVTDEKWAFADLNVGVHVVVVVDVISVRSGLQTTWTNLSQVASASHTRIAPIKL